MSINDEITRMTDLFMKVIMGSVYKDCMVVGGEMNMEEDSGEVELVVGLLHSPYAYPHTELSNTRLYKKVIENNLSEIEAADNDDLENLVEHLNDEFHDNIDIKTVEESMKSYLQGAYEFNYKIISANPETELSKIDDSFKVNITPFFVDGEYFIYEDLALIRAGLDDNISNSPDCKTKGKLPEIPNVNKGEDEDDILWDIDVSDW